MIRESWFWVTTLAYLAGIWWQGWWYQRCARRRTADIAELREAGFRCIQALETHVVLLKHDLARAGRALMAHPQGHDQDLIDDAMGWVADETVADLRRRGELTTTH